MGAMVTSGSVMESSKLWRRTLAAKGDSQELDRERLRVALLSFRSRIIHVVADIRSQLPSLTVHDITHLDALWGVADEIIGDTYPLNEAEAFILGGAFLLHDAAHAISAYKGGKEELKSSIEWRDFVALRLSGNEPANGSKEEELALFHVLRHLHAQQAQKLPELKWIDANGQACYLIEDSELRNYYGQAIGDVAASHHWDPAVVANRLKGRRLTPPGFLVASKWNVDVLKIAMILRTADAAHIDSARAPWFLFALRQPEGISRDHWNFQSKLGKVQRLSNGELKISSGPSFQAHERASWWLAFDVAKMIDAELRSARMIMQDEGRAPFEAHSVKGVSSAADFASEVPVSGWEPVDVRAKISDVPHLIERLGGAALYGHRPEVALRELMQNAIDACCAYESLHSIGGRRLFVNLSSEKNGFWRLSVSDNGIGMSRYVLAEVLLDFGRSIWSGDIVQELPGLASSGFRSGGKFGIGFFSIFMLGSDVSVVTRRFERAAEDMNDQWLLEFADGLHGRPSLSVPSAVEKLKECGTKVSVVVNDSMLRSMLGIESDAEEDKIYEKLNSLVQKLAPGSPVDIYVSMAGGKLSKVIEADDWRKVEDALLLKRIGADGPKKVFPLFDDNGRIVGRLAPTGRWSSRRAVGLVRGLAATSIQGIVGVVEVSGNNTNATRTEAAVFHIKERWEEWAKSIVSGNEKKPKQYYLTLNPLLPDSDFPVWTYLHKQINLTQLKAEIADSSEIYLHMGDIAYDEDDPVGSSSFDSEFSPVSEVLIGPSDYYQRGSFAAQDASGFPWVLGYSRVDYQDALRAVLSQVWGSFEETDEFAEVGSVYGADITRNVTVFKKL